MPRDGGTSPRARRDGLRVPARLPAISGVATAERMRRYASPSEMAKGAQASPIEQRWHLIPACLAPAGAIGPPRSPAHCASYGAQVQVCSDYGSALEHARADNPDLIVAAVGYMEDLGFVSAIRGDPATQFTPLVALTASASESADQLSLYDNGADAALLKPIKTEALLGRVDRLLRLRRDPDLALVHLGVETKDLDYKESVGLDCRDGRAALAKDVIAMANSGGGRIIVGIPEDDLAAFEPSRLNRALRDYLDPPVSVGVKQVRDGGRVFAILEVPPGAEMVILAGKENDRTGLRRGRVYVRTSSVESAEVRDSSELRPLLERVIAARTSANSTGV